MIYGYARVSTDGQSLDAQVKQLRAAGAEKVLRETASGAKTDRVQLRRALDQLAKGDVLMVTRLDRLARSTRDLLNTLATITAKGAGFRSLNDACRHHHRARAVYAGRAGGGGLAEFERTLIHARTGEGRERAKARGVKMGRKPKPPPTSSARGSSGATRRRSRCARLPGPIRFLTARFHGLRHERDHPALHRPRSYRL
jgi:DNA invertase Pin-like site-specific DNA recombinase